MPRCTATRDDMSRCGLQEGHAGEHRPRTARGTTLRNVRITDDLWRRAGAVAASRDESLSDVIRSALERYVKRHE